MSPRSRSSVVWAPEGRGSPPGRSTTPAPGGRYGDRIVTCHGGAIERPAGFEALLAKEPRLDGYVGGSSAERFPVEEAVPRATRAFKAIRTRPR